MTRTKCSMALRFLRPHALARNSSTVMPSRRYTCANCPSGRDTLTVRSFSSREPTW